DAQPDGGAIQISLHQINYDSNRQNNADNSRIELRVKDAGQGLDPEVRSRLFEPFVSTKETGTGLGLSICRRIVEAHGGTISADDAQPHGTVFLISLPA